MKRKLLNKSFLSIFVALVAILFILTACEPPDGGSGNGDPVPIESMPPDELGGYSECSYNSGLSSSGYGSARVFYPCETSNGPFPATTLTGGFTNTKEQMYWLAEHLVTHGYIVIAITPTLTVGTAPMWERAHKSGIAKLKDENTRTTSPIYGLVDTTKLQIAGYSMGGGGTLLAANDLGDEIASAQAFAPFGGGTNLSGVSAATLCLSGGTDTTATPSSIIRSYDSLPNSIERTYAEFSGLGHMVWVFANSSTRERLQTYITSWMKVYLDEDDSYNEYLDGHQNWFDEFAINIDVSVSGGCD